VERAASNIPGTSVSKFHFGEPIGIAIPMLRYLKLIRDEDNS
jgi:hypothetical protein